jgi:SAM-dependent methyltransferase
MGGEASVQTASEPDYAALCHQMSEYDVVSPEGFVRNNLDRNIGRANEYFAQAFGYDRAPLQASVDRLQALGSVALLDVGCGTGNTLRTWAAAMRMRAASPDLVTAMGINLADYRAASRFPQTHRAIRRGEITYIIGDAQHMNDVSSASADVLLACMSAFHMSQPELALNAMDRVARPGAIMFLNVRGELNVTGSPIMERMFELEDEGYGVDTRTGIIPHLKGGESWTTLFIRIEKPEKT